MHLGLAETSSEDTSKLHDRVSYMSSITIVLTLLPQLVSTDSKDDLPWVSYIQLREKVSIRPCLYLKGT